MSEVKRFFFEKKKQKTFPIGARTNRLGSKGKSFLLLFFKKEALPSFPWPRLALCIPAALLLLIAILSPERFEPTSVAGPASLAPNATYWFGTDSAGLDVFSQLIASTRIDIALATATAVVATLAGILLGLAIGMNEDRRSLAGLAARGLARLFDFVQALPAIIVALTIISFYGARPLSISLAFALLLTPPQLRLVRTEVLRVRHDAFIDAARLAGLSEWQLALRHVVPNACAPALRNATAIFGLAIILNAALGFLGVGLPPPTPEWGAMIARGATDAAVGRWWPAGFPVLALMITVASAALLSAGLFPHSRTS
jgi:peptide/nickel transport system permease protein